jgi:hypothetical protein
MDFDTQEANIVVISGVMLFLSFLYYDKINFITLSILFSYIFAAIKIDCMINGNCLFYSRYIAFSIFLITIIAIMSMPNYEKYLYYLTAIVN